MKRHFSVARAGVYDMHHAQCEHYGPGKRGHIVADTLLPMMFHGLRKLGNICCRHKMFLNKISYIFCVPDTKFVSATNVAHAGKQGNVCVGNNVSATMCPCLPGPLGLPLIHSVNYIMFIPQIFCVKLAIKFDAIRFPI